jgi:hypothetical protein
VVPDIIDNLFEMHLDKLAGDPRYIVSSVAGANPAATDPALPNEGECIAAADYRQKVDVGFIADVAGGGSEYEHRFPRRCAHCNTMSPDIRGLCNRCKRVWYCNLDCQTTHWFEGGHMEVCGAGSCGSCCKQLPLSAIGKKHMCTRCKQVAYCNNVCQTEHWNHGGHRKKCPVLEVRYKKSKSGTEDFEAAQSQAESQRLDDPSPKKQEEGLDNVDPPAVFTACIRIGGWSINLLPSRRPMEQTDGENTDADDIFAC